MTFSSVSVIGNACVSGEPGCEPPSTLEQCPERSGSPRSGSSAESRYTRSVSWRHRIAVVLLTALAGLPVSGTVCAMVCESASNARSKSWNEFARLDSPPLDFVFTVCDRAAEEVCPVWPGQPMTAHWGIHDPAVVEGTQEEKMRAFNAAFESSMRA